MLKYKFNLKNGIAKARMCMAACVAVSTLTLGFTSRAAAMPEEMLPEASFTYGGAVFVNNIVAEINNKSVNIRFKAAEGVEEVLAEATIKA